MKTILNFYAYLKKDFLLMYKRKKYLFTFILLPILIAGIFLFALNPGDYEISVGVCDFDHSASSGKVLQLNQFEIIPLEGINCIDKIKEGIKEGDFPLGLVIEEGFEDNLNNLKQSSLSVYYDNTDISFASLMSWKVDLALAPAKTQIIDKLNQELGSNVASIRSNTNLILDSLPLSGVFEEKAEEIDTKLENVEGMSTNFLVNPIKTEHKTIYPDKSGSDISIIFVFPVLVLFITLMLASTSIIYDRKSKFLTRVKSSASLVNYLFAKIVFFVALVVVQFLIVYLLFLLSGASYELALGNVLLLILSIALVNSLLGFIIGLISDNEGIAVLFSLIISFPLMLVSGLFFPVQTLPSLIQKLANLLPLNSQIAATKSVLLFGEGFSSGWIIYVLVLLIAVFYILRKKE